MALVLVNSGEVIMLEAFFNKTAPQNQLLKLYAIDTSITESVTLGSFTICTGGGYSDQTLTGSSWNAATAGDPTYITYAQQTFSFTGAPTTNTSMYGYLVNQSVSTTLMYAERFSDGPYTIVNNGDAIKITPRFEMS